MIETTLSRVGRTYAPGKYTIGNEGVVSSSASINDSQDAPAGGLQDEGLFTQKGEEYMRESGNIQDYPDRDDDLAEDETDKEIEEVALDADAADIDEEDVDDLDEDLEDDLDEEDDDDDDDESI